jgi:hypothetical protein
VLRVAYRIFPLDPTAGGTPRPDAFWLPVVSVRLVLGERAVRVEGIVDSGSHGCLFDWRVGELLGLDVRAGERDRPVGADTEALPGRMPHRISEMRYEGPRHATFPARLESNKAYAESPDAETNNSDCSYTDFRRDRGV